MRRLFLYSGIVALLASPAVAQEADSRVALAREDSIDFLQAARSDQASFERFRRGKLPYTWGGGSVRCDERIGRFCLNHQKGGTEWVAPPEDSTVVEARDKLITDLGIVARLLPGDGWVAGQRIRYLVEARRFEEARTAATECRADAWWCAALLGFASHYAGRPVEADEAFASALDLMASSERDRWTDLTMILDDRTVRTYRRLSDEEKGTFEARFWAFADPLLTTPGNELQAEHLARHVWDQLQFRAQSTDGISWGYDLREIVLRYGWPTGWEQIREFDLRATGPPSLVSHYSSSPQYLLPPSETLLSETGTDGIWEAEEERSRTGYALSVRDSVAKWFWPLQHQVAVFRRADSVSVVGAYELPPDSLAENAAVRAGLALLPTGGDVEARVVLEEQAGATAALLGYAPAAPLIISLEAIATGDRRLARARYGLDLAPADPGLVAVSDLLLLRGGGELPITLEDAVNSARGSTSVRSGEEIGLYWEVYGVQPQNTPSLTMSLRLVQGNPSWLRRLGERTGLLREIAPIRLRWEEPVNPGPHQARSLHVEIPEVSAGDYAIELTIEAPGREPLTVRREIAVID